MEYFFWRFGDLKNTSHFLKKFTFNLNPSIAKRELAFAFSLAYQVYPNIFLVALIVLGRLISDSTIAYINLLPYQHLLSMDNARKPRPISFYIALILKNSMEIFLKYFQDMVSFAY